MTDLGHTTVDAGSSTAVALRPGDVLRYLPADKFMRWHCREGIALVTETGDAFDTFWGTGGDRHRLTADELATAEVEFNVGDYDALPYRSRDKWLTYHEDDRGRIPSQHGLQEVLYLRKGAQPNLATQIANAREAVAEAESRLRSAEWTLEWRREDLAKLQEQEASNAS